MAYPGEPGLSGPFSRRAIALSFSVSFRRRRVIAAALVRPWTYCNLPHSCRLRCSLLDTLL